MCVSGHSFIHSVLKWGQICLLMCLCEGGCLRPYKSLFVQQDTGANGSWPAIHNPAGFWERAWTQTLSVLPAAVNLSYLSHLSHQSERKREGQQENDIRETTRGKQIRMRSPEALLKPPWERDQLSRRTSTLNTHFLCISSPNKHVLVVSDGKVTSLLLCSGSHCCHRGKDKWNITYTHISWM